MGTEFGRSREWFSFLSVTNSQAECKKVTRTKQSFSNLYLCFVFLGSLRNHWQKGTEVIPHSDLDPDGEFCITRCVNCKSLREEILISAAPAWEVSPGSSLLRALKGQSPGKGLHPATKAEVPAGPWDGEWLDHTPNPSKAKTSHFKPCQNTDGADASNLFLIGFADIRFAVLLSWNQRQKSLSCQIAKTPGKDLILNAGCDYLTFFFFASCPLISSPVSSALSQAAHGCEQERSPRTKPFTRD